MLGPPSCHRKKRWPSFPDPCHDQAGAISCAWAQRNCGTGPTMGTKIHKTKDAVSHISFTSFPLVIVPLAVWGRKLPQKEPALCPRSGSRRQFCEVVDPGASQSNPPLLCWSENWEKHVVSLRDHRKLCASLRIYEQWKETRLMYRSHLQITSSVCCLLIE